MKFRGKTRADYAYTNFPCHSRLHFRWFFYTCYMNWLLIIVPNFIYFRPVDSINSDQRDFPAEAVYAEDSLRVAARCNSITGQQAAYI
jgi:hypothetical protein